MPSVGFEPTISADERPQTYAIDRAVTGTNSILIYVMKIIKHKLLHAPLNGA